MPVQDETQHRFLSAIIVLSAVVGAMVSAAAILYRFRERLGLSRLWEQFIKNGSKEKDCYCYVDEQCEEEKPAEQVPAEEKPADA